MTSAVSDSPADDFDVPAGMGRISYKPPPKKEEVKEEKKDDKKDAGKEETVKEPDQKDSVKETPKQPANKRNAKSKKEVRSRRSESLFAINLFTYQLMQESTANHNDNDDREGNPQGRIRVENITIKSESADPQHHV